MIGMTAFSETCHFLWRVWCSIPSSLLPWTVSHHGTAITTSAGDDVTNQQKIAALITALGDSDYATRESATQQLRTVADYAIDQLLDAANQSHDLEVALRSQWILETVSLTGPDDYPRGKGIIKKFLEPFPVSADQCT